MDTLQIELSGIIKLKDCLIRSDFLQPYINENDKTPSWDGYIYVYRKQGKKKIDLLSCVSIQAKGKITDSIISDICNFPLDRSDLENYFNDGGIILFVICLVNFDVYKIYYVSLTQLRLKRYIKEMKDQKSITITLNTFPMNDIVEVTDIFFQFADEIKTRISDNILSLNDLLRENPLGFDQLSVTYTGIGYKNPEEYFASHTTTLYAIHSKAGLKIPVDIVSVFKTKTESKQKIEINGKVYYTSCSASVIKDETKITIGESFSFIQRGDNKENIDMNFTLKGNLSQRILDLGLFLDFLKNDKIKIGEIEFIFQSVEENWKIANAEYSSHYSEKYLKYLLEIKETLKILSVSEELDCSNLSEKDENNIRFLISTILRKQPQKINEKHNVMLGKVKISNIIVQLIAIRRRKNKFCFENYYNTKLEMSYRVSKNPEIYKPISIYLGLKKLDFLTVSNINYDIIYESFFNQESHEVIYNLTNNLVLEMIAAYDVSKNRIILETALKIIDLIINKNHITEPIYIINKLQIIRRMREFTDDEISQLNDITKDSNENIIITGAYSLLGDKELANNYYRKMSIQEQNDFKECSISIFLDI